MPRCREISSSDVGWNMWDGGCDAHDEILLINLNILRHLPQRPQRDQPHPPILIPQRPPKNPKHPTHHIIHKRVPHRIQYREQHEDCRFPCLRGGVGTGGGEERDEFWPLGGGGGGGGAGGEGGGGVEFVVGDGGDGAGDPVADDLATNPFQTTKSNISSLSFFLRDRRKKGSLVETHTFSANNLSNNPCLILVLNSRGTACQNLKSFARMRLRSSVEAS